MRTCWQRRCANCTPHQNTAHGCNGARRRWLERLAGTGERVDLAWQDAEPDGRTLACRLFGCPVETPILAYHDARTGQERFAWFVGETLKGALFLAPEPVAVSRAWAVEQLSTRFTQASARLGVVAGRPGRGVAEKGATVCSCFSIGVNQITTAVTRGCRTVAAVGEVTQAGTNCGSCRAEIQGIIDVYRLQAAE